MEVNNWRDLSRLGRDAEFGSLARPEHVGGFFAEYAERLNPRRVLDPFAVSPVLACAITEAVPAASVTAVTPSGRAAEVGEKLGPTVTWEVEEPSVFLRAPGDEYDLVVASPPIGLRLGKGLDGSDSADLPPASIWRSEVAHLVLCLAAARLTAEGKLVFLLGQGSLIRPDGEGMRAYLAEQRIGMVASVSFRDGLAPSSYVETYAGVFARQPTEDLFIARIGPATPRREVVENLVRHRIGSTMELGALVDGGSYRGWQLAKVNRELEESLRGGSEVLTIGAAALRIKRLRLNRGDPDPDFDNAVYLPEVGTGPVRVQVDWSTGKGETRSFMAIELDPDRADAEYVAQWLNGPQGRLARQGVARGVVPRIAAGDLAELRIPLPPLGVQRRSAELRRRVVGLLTELDALSDRIATSASRSSLDSATWELRRLLEGDDIEAWAGRLPFPIASILERCFAEADSRRRQDHLLFFFEAFTAFAATLLLSAARASDRGWARASELIGVDLFSSHVLRRADFGRWLHIGKTLAGMLHVDLGVYEGEGDEAGDSARSAALGVTSSHFYLALVDTEMWNLLDQARMIRNRHKGHGGDVSEGQLQLRVRELEQLLGALHQRCSRAFDGVMLVQPGESGYDGGAHRFRRAKRLMGATNVSKEVTIRTVFPLKADALYLVDQREDLESFLEVLPLVRVLPRLETEENVCYFYSAIVDPNTLRFVSYHFPGEVEIPLADSGLEEPV